MIVSTIIISDSIYLWIWLKDEAPHLVNPIVASFVARHSRARATVSTVS